mmetsp:Transcript_38371/g.89789  ORF Transcript_38371/g.89789 Transcript_38371/m.89789 type:complete len:280 (-) Transcript_38371:899-1738(-)
MLKSNILDSSVFVTTQMQLNVTLESHFGYTIRRLSRLSYAFGSLSHKLERLYGTRAPASAPNPPTRPPSTHNLGRHLATHNEAAHELIPRGLLARPGAHAHGGAELHFHGRIDCVRLPLGQPFTVGIAHFGKVGEVRHCAARRWAGRHRCGRPGPQRRVGAMGGEAGLADHVREDGGCVGGRGEEVGHGPAAHQVPQVVRDLSQCAVHIRIARDLVKVQRALAFQAELFLQQRGVRSDAGHLWREHGPFELTRAEAVVFGDAQHHGHAVPSARLECLEA